MEKIIIETNVENAVVNVCCDITRASWVYHKFKLKSNMFGLMDLSRVRGFIGSIDLKIVERILVFLIINKIRFC